MDIESVIELHRRPWLPSINTSLVDVWDEFNVPTVGLVNVDGRNFIFLCLAGHTRQQSLWMYVESHGESPLLSHDGDRAGFDERLDSLIVGRPAMFALADEENGIEHAAYTKQIDANLPLDVQAAEALSLGKREAMDLEIELYA